MLRRKEGGTPLYLFFAKGLAWLLVLTLAWSQVSHWATRPASQLAYMTLEGGFRWVDKARHVGPDFTVDTWLKIPAPGGAPGTVGLLVAETQPARYGYGLPLLFALLLASGSRRWLRYGLIGAVILIPFQAFGIVFDILKQATISAGPMAIAQTGFARWQVEGIALGYQAGVLLLPTLVPVMIWLLLERKFLAAVLADGLMRRQTLPAQSSVATTDADGSFMP